MALKLYLKLLTLKIDLKIIAYKEYLEYIYGFILF